jgi:hypothetical protein
VTVSRIAELVACHSRAWLPREAIVWKVKSSGRRGPLAHKAHRLWERWKYPACGLVDNAASPVSSVFQAWLAPGRVSFDDGVKNQQKLAHSRNQSDLVQFAAHT